MDVEAMISHLEDLDRGELVRLSEALAKRLRELGGEPSEGGERKPVSDVVEYRPHADGYLQAEVRRYFRKDGSAKEHGPYWYFRYHEGGKQRTLYLGKTDDPEVELARKRS
jgi:hypothetical protein